MQGSLLYFEGDDPNTLHVRVYSTASSRGTSSNATPALSKTSHPRSHGGSVTVGVTWCQAMWWTDGRDDSLHIFAMPSDDVPRSSSSYVRHVILSYPVPCCAATVFATLYQGRLQLTAAWCSPMAELFLSELSLARDATDGSISLTYSKSLSTPLHLGGSHNVVALAVPHRSAASRSTTAFVVASPRAVWSVFVDETGTALESKLYEITLDDSTISGAAILGDKNLLFIAVSSPQNRSVVRVIDAAAASSSSVAQELSIPGRDVTVQELVGSPCNDGVFALARDNILGNECVVQLSTDGDSPRRVSGFGSMTVASVGPSAEGTAITWANNQPIVRAPLYTGADVCASPTVVHCPALAPHPFHVDVPDPRVAVIVTTAAEQRPALLVVSGSSPRTRIVAVTGILDLGEAPRSTYAFHRVLRDRSSGRPVGDCGIFPVCSSAASPSDAREFNPAWHDIVDAGGDVVAALPDGPELMQQILSTVVARPHHVARCAAFDRLVATARSLDVSLPAPHLHSSLMKEAVLGLLRVSPGAASLFAIDGVGLHLAGYSRFRLATVCTDLHRRLLGLIFVRLAWRMTCPSDVELDVVSERALLHVTAALAMLRAAGTHIERLVAHESPSPADLVQVLLPQSMDVLFDDSRVLRAAIQLQILPAEAGVAMKAISALVATWIVQLPLLHHFTLLETVLKHDGPAASSLIVQDIHNVAAAIVNLPDDAAVGRYLNSLVRVAVDGDEDGGWVDEILQFAEDSVQRRQLAATVYCALILRDLVHDSGTGADLIPSDVSFMSHHVESMLNILCSESAPERVTALCALKQVVTGLLNDCRVFCCRASAQQHNFKQAFKELHMLVTVPSPAVALQVEECTAFIVSTMAECGRAPELCQHILITDSSIAQSVASNLYQLIVNPKAGNISDRGEHREAQRVEATATLVTFLTSRGALGSAARAAFDVACALRSTPVRGPQTLERAFATMCLALNTVEVIPGPVAHYNSGAAATPSGIQPLTRADLPELTRRCQQLACEVKLALKIQVNCAPWEPLGAMPSRSDVDAASDIMYEAISARMWTDALLMADLWNLNTDAVFSSWATDLLEHSSSSSVDNTNIDDDQWAQLIAAAEARSEPRNHFATLRRLATLCLSHPKYQCTPERLTMTFIEADPQAFVAFVLAMPRIPASLLDQALHVALGRLPREALSVSLLDRLAVIARQINSSMCDAIVEEPNFGRPQLHSRCREFLTALSKYMR